MEKLIRWLVTILAAIAVMLAVRITAGAEQVKGSMPVSAKSGAVHAAPARRLPAVHMESILTDLRGAMTTRKRGEGWLLHYGTENDTCARPDATSGARVMCVSW